jgi:hypothetical protein
VVPISFFSFFIASAGAGAALVGLLFVAVSVAPEHSVMPSAPLVRQALATSTFTALVNPFFISLCALVPKTNIGYITLIMGGLSLFNSVLLGWKLVRTSHSWTAMARRATLIAVGLVLYGLECTNAISLLRDPAAANALAAVTSLVVLAYGLGLVRAWQLLGARRFGILGWLSVTRELADDEDTPASAATDAPDATSARPRRAAPNRVAP